MIDTGVAKLTGKALHTVKTAAGWRLERRIYINVPMAVFCLCALNHCLHEPKRICRADICGWEGVVGRITTEVTKVAPTGVFRLK